MTNSYNVAAPLILTIILYYFSGVALMTENLLFVVIISFLATLSLYWLIQRLDSQNVQKGNNGGQDE